MQPSLTPTFSSFKSMVYYTITLKACLGTSVLSALLSIRYASCVPFCPGSNLPPYITYLVPVETRKSLLSNNMATLQYFSRPGKGEYQRDNYWYNEAVRVGDRLECAGQGTCLSAFSLALQLSAIATHKRTAGPMTTKNSPASRWL